jgi:hypothetical protein
MSGVIEFLRMWSVKCLIKGWKVKSSEEIQVSQSQEQ